MTLENAISAFVLGNGLNGLGVVRSLGRHKIPVYVFGGGKERFAFKSRYANPILLEEPENENSIIQSLLKESAKLNHKPVLFYTTDFFLKLISHHYDLLSKHFLIQISSPEAIETVANKKKFKDFVVGHGFPVPNTYIFETISQVTDIADKLEYPVLLKPSESFHWKKLDFKVVHINDKQTLIERWKSLQGTCDDLLIQQLIPGADDRNYAYYSYRTQENGEVLSVCVNKPRLTPIHGGVGAFSQVVSDKEIEDIGFRLLDKLQYIGVASVCMKRHEKTGEPLIYEVNGRMPLGHVAIQMCGYDLPYIMYCDIIQSPVSVPKEVKKHGKWCSMGLDINAFRGYHKQGEISLWNWIKSYRGVRTCAEFAWDDLRPFFFCLKQILSKVFGKVKRTISRAQ